MAKELDRRVKAAMDETRLLVLGVQVLLGFELQCFFQDGFETLSRGSKSISGLGLGLVIASLGLLVVPSMIHQVAEYGRSTARMVRTTNAFAGLGLVPLTAGLGLSAYVVLERHFGSRAGLAGGIGLACIAGFGWFGLELLMGSQTKGPPMQASRTPLAIRIDQLLTEARVIIPGAQALFGFQFVAMLTTGFDKLPQGAKIVHAGALLLIAINVILLMTPAALHRLSFAGEDSELFFRIGSGFVIASPVFLAGGIALEFYVVVLKAYEGEGWAWAGACLIFVVLITLWYVLPLALRSRKIPNMRTVERKVA
jgi:hypothetical protein